MLHDITDLRFFVTITESGSLAEAARRLDVTPSAVSQRLRHLEGRLGMPLAQRSTRQFVLTEEGELFREGVAGVLEHLDRLVNSMRERSGELTGTLSIGAPSAFGRRHLAAAIAEFHALHPQLKASLTLSDSLTAADAPRFDLMLHAGPVTEPTLATHPIAPNQRLLCAAPAYLERRAAPREPKELGQHDCLVVRESPQEVAVWRFRKRHHDVSVRVPAMLGSSDADVVTQWGLAGKGVFVRSEWDLAEHLAAGELVRVLPDWTLPPADIVAVAGQRTPPSGRAKFFLQFLQARFQPVPPWRRDLPRRKD